LNSNGGNSILIQHL